MDENKIPFVSGMRQNYRRGRLRRKDLMDSPVAQFTAWLKEAVAAQVLEPNAMALATASAQGRPSCRIVLLKQYSDQGFLFFTNLKSRKADELTENPYAMAVFFWDVLEKQVSIEGKVERVSEAEADAYFTTRPRASQIASWASPQGNTLPSREMLDQAFNQAALQYQDQPIPRPPFWGGYRLIPSRFEFWQGGLDRLHDRFQYLLDNQNAWEIERVAP
jgi:pyridoxamine 5'-phosphate oxidase